MVSNNRLNPTFISNDIIHSESISNCSKEVPLGGRGGQMEEEKERRREGRMEGRMERGREE